MSSKSSYSRSNIKRRKKSRRNLKVNNLIKSKAAQTCSQLIIKIRKVSLNMTVIIASLLIHLTKNVIR